MFRMISGVVGLALATACDQGPLVFTGSTSTDPTADFDIQPPDVDTARPTDRCAESDLDGDGYGPDCERGDDCDNENPAVNPGEIEVPYNGVDDDCNATTREDDLDNDGVGIETDCDDNDNTVSPLKPELCNDGIDNDCNAATPDEGEFGELTCPWVYTNRDHCKAILNADSAKAGVDGYYLTRNGAVWCDMTTESGGWTLVMVSADDGADTFTFGAAGLLGSETTEIGALGEFNSDFKSWAYNRVRFNDLMFAHKPSDTFAVYGGVGDGSRNLGAITVAAAAATAAPVCFDPAASPYPTAGYPMTAGNLATGSGSEGRALCSTDLYFNVGDHAEGDKAACEAATGASAERAYGPVWNTSSDCASTPFEDAALGGLGPNGAAATTETPSVGWGGALGLNTSEETGGNRMYLYVR